MSPIARASSPMLLGLKSILLTLSLASCGTSTPASGGGTDAASGAATHRYRGAGSVWSVTLNADGSFVVTHAPSVGAAADLTFSGTYQVYPTGFLGMTVGSVTGTGGTDARPPAVGALVVGLEVPGSVFFLQPADGGGLVTMIPAGVCPTAAIKANWILLRAGASWRDTKDTFGALDYDPSLGGAVKARYDIASFAYVGPNNPSFSGCAEGYIGVVGSGNADIFLNQAGGAIIHGNLAGESAGEDSIVYAMPVSAGATAANVAGNYAGLVFDKGSGGGGASPTYPVSVQLAAAGGGSAGPAQRLSDVATGATATDGLRLTLNAAGPLPGSVTGTLDFGGITGGGATKNIACNVQQNANGTTKTVLTCASESPTGAFMSLLLVSH